MNNNTINTARFARPFLALLIAGTVGCAGKDPIATQIETLGGKFTRSASGVPVEVSLNDTAATDADVAQLVPWKTLTLVNLAKDKKVTDAAADSLSQLPDLVELWISETAMGDKAVEKLAVLTKLKRLNLQDTPITDAALDVAAKLPVLEELWINQTGVTDDGLAKFIGHPTLKRLDVRLCPKVTDAAVEAFAKMPALKDIHARQSGMTPAAEAKMKELRPDIRLRMN